MLFVVGCASTGTIHEAEVVKKYDSIEGLTYWTHTPILVRNTGIGKNAAVSMNAIGVCKGQHTDVPCDSAGWALAFQVQGGGLTDNTNLTLRLGERRIRPESENYNADTGGLYNYKEKIVYQLDRKDIRDLATLPKGEVEGRLAGTRLNLSYERRKGVRLLHQKFSAE